MKISLEEEPASPSARLMQAQGFNLYILAIMGFTKAIDVNAFKQGLEQTLLKHPRFSSVLVVKDKKHNMSWKKTKVDIDNHVFYPELDSKIESSDQFIEDYASYLSTSSMDMTKPLWEVHLLNVQTSDANSIAIFKFHHSIGDGVSLISILMACSKKTSDPQSLPSIPIKKQEVLRDGVSLGKSMKKIFFSIWLIIIIIFNTLIDLVLFMVTIIFMKDTHTSIRGPRGVELSPKRFVHRVVSLDDIKLVKTAMNVSINDVVLGVTQAGLSHYLNNRYIEELKEKGVGIVKNINYLPKRSCLRAALVFNLRPTATIQDLAEMMETESKGMWGNLFGIGLLPFNIKLQNDPLNYIREAKVAMDRKKRSLQPKCVFVMMKLLINLFGIKFTAAITRSVFYNTTLTFSNVVGPKEEITLFGHPMCYLAPSAYGIPHALTIHCQSYANKLIFALAVDENVIPNPHQLCDDLENSLNNIKNIVMEKGLADQSQFAENV
ncbi:hypothetical protein RD792_007992 [Penstemon davidsonii]|uniref:Diacylglycerol O-acyltransferase n=1 Tax=Penstemon davidsonii TaxID=160366 RepID=A0ABR0D984_9LAMI|nr:hypothetical protein RD792_007992 [Penstemon davidsonii]